MMKQCSMFAYDANHDGARKPTDALELMLTVQQISESWSLDSSTVRELFDKEAGVMVITNSKSRKRRYRTLRIPRSVAIRVQRRLSVLLKVA
jgi:hypothetical protein